MSGPAPGSAEWLRVVTASKVAAIIGVSPFESPYSIWHTMSGRVPRDDVNTTHTRRGTILEPAVIEWWLSEHPEAVEIGRQGFYSLAPWCGATTDLDVTIRDELALVEVKTSARADEWGESGTDLIPVHYLTQVYWQLAMCPRAARAHVAVLLGPGLEFRQYTVERDQGIESDLIARCEAFYASLDGDTPPPLDDHPATVESLRRQHPDIEDVAANIPPDAAREWIAAKVDLEQATTRERGARAQILNAMGRARHGETGGVRVARRQPSRYGVSLIPTVKSPDLIPGVPA